MISLNLTKIFFHQFQGMIFFAPIPPPIEPIIPPIIVPITGHIAVPTVAPKTLPPIVPPVPTAILANPLITASF